jgi:hypothetical protein
MIGTTTEGNGDGDDLTIATSGRTGMTIRSADDDYGNIFFSDSTSGASEYVGKVQYYHADNTMRFATNSIDRVRIESGGNLKILDGDLVIGASGHGIDFSDTSDASGMTSELLDDYEEGTWTPAYNSGSASSACFASGISYNTGGQTGLYTKIGNVVYFRFNIDPSSSGLTAKTGILQINGLPFTPANTSNINSGAAFYMFTNAFGSATLPNAVVLQNTSVIQFYDGNGGIFRGVDLSAPQNAIQMVGMYHAA